MADNQKGIMASSGAAAGMNASRQDFIKFDPEKIMAVSDKLEQQHKRFTQTAASISKHAERLMASWQGDSAEAYIAKIKELDTQSIEIAGELLVLSKSLAQASGIYKTGESDAKQETESLPVDGVFLV